MYKWILQILEISLKKGFGRGNKKENFWDPNQAIHFMASSTYQVQNERAKQWSHP